jgi:hypothetical protein
VPEARARAATALQNLRGEIATALGV